MSKTVLDKGSTHQLNDPQSSAEARAERLKYLVDWVIKMPLSELCRKYPLLKFDTLRGYLSSRHGGMGDRSKQINNILEASQSEGVRHLTKEWLLYGIGSPPIPQDGTRPFELKSQHPTIDSDNSDNKNCFNELRYFRSLSPRSLDLVVEDDAMHPEYKIGDLVAGTIYEREKLNELTGKICLIQTSKNELILRKIQKINEKNLLTLTAINPETTIANPTLYDISILNIAPAIWRRRRLENL